MSAQPHKLTTAADERKARLAQLKSLKRKQPAGEEAAGGQGSQDDGARKEGNEEEDVARKLLSGRNYDPAARGPKLGFESAPLPQHPTLEEQASGVEAEVRRRAAEDARDDAGIDLFRLQPKKPNWDLKRDLDVKLDTLNVRTDNAIARMVRERIAASKAGASRATDGQESLGVDGTTFVEGLRLREREEEEEERRETEDQMEP